MTYLLDTNVISEVRKPVPDPGVEAWFQAVPTGQLYLSVLVIGELRQGVERLARRDAAHAAALDRWLRELVRRFDDRIAPITVDVAAAWGRLSAPDPLSVVDGLLAATAMVRGWTLVTRNGADVRRTGVRLLDPFAA